MKNAVAVRLATLLLCVVAVFACKWHLLGGGWVSEDSIFAGLRAGTPAEVGYRIQLRNASDALELFSPYRGWFWRPAALFYFPAVVAIFGANAVVFHALSLAAHAVVIWLAGWLVFRTTQSTAAAVASCVAFLFWPNNTEAVSWISSVTTLMCVGWGLASAHFWLSFRQSGRRGAYAAAVLSLVIASTWKNEIIFVPVFWLLIDTVLENLDMRRVWRPYILPVLWLGFFAWVERTATAGYSELTPGFGRALHFTLPERVAAVWAFAGALFDNGNVATLYLTSSVVGLAFLCWVYAIEARARRSVVVFAAASAALFVVMPLVAGSAATAERFHYAPFLFACMALGVALTAECPNLLPSLATSGAVGALAAAAVWSTGLLADCADGPIVVFAGVTVIGACLGRTPYRAMIRKKPTPPVSPAPEL